MAQQTVGELTTWSDELVVGVEIVIETLKVSRFSTRCGG